MRHLELFAGIGGFRQALTLLSEDFNFEQRTVGFSEIDKNAVKTYKAAFDTSGETEMGDIIEFNSNPSNIDAIEDFDLLTGGFPCQPFSMMGAQKGFTDERGTLFFQITEILKHKQPKYVILENVRNLTLHDNNKTLQTMVKKLRECGYQTVQYDLFNTSQFDLAQKRSRVYIFASNEAIDVDFKLDNVLTSFRNITEKTSILRQKNTHEVLEKKVDEKYYLSEKIKPTILADGSKTFQSHSDINQMVARPLTATMTKMHRACQDNYYSDGFINSDDPESYIKINYSKEELAKQRIRKITPREALMLQGFGGDYLEKALSSGVSDHQLYHQAGNAVSVNTVYAIMHYLFIEKGLIK